MSAFEEPPDPTIGRGPDVEIADFGHDPEMELALDIKRPGASFADATDAVAKTAVELVKAGRSVSEVADAVGLTVGALVAMPAARRALSKLRAEYALNAEELKELVKTKAVKVALEGDDKVALDALKLIAQMPDVGLSGTLARTNIAVGIFSDETNKVLSAIDLKE